VPRAGQLKPRDHQRLTDHVALGVLTATFPPSLVDAVIEATGTREQRYRLLPARLVVYYVLAMTLFPAAGYEEVLRSLTEGLAWGTGWTDHWAVPSQVAISKARARLGRAPLAELFARACRPLATPATRGAFYRGLRLVGLDGTTLDLADTAAHAAHFGRPGSGRGEGVGAFPQLRMVALAECGTHAMFAVAMGPCTTGEPTLAKQLTEALRPGMLCLADRGFMGFPLWSAAAATGAELVWRTRGNAVLPVLARHPDGSYGSELVAADDRGREHPLPVRVVEYTLDDPGRDLSEETRYRLVTTILDPVAAPAAELAALYAERWEIESALDELKTHQRGPRVVLRSRTVEGVYQEAWGFCCVHYALRALLASAADDEDVDPDRLSFTRALHAARRSVRSGVSGGAGLAVALRHAIAEILACLLPLRRLRANARVVKRKMSNYGLKRAAHRAWSSPSLPPAEAVRVLSPP
jgi:Insertion element 4 transposase N-terminal/Transposase DDE domain